MEAMRRGGLDLPPMGGEGKVVEADETYFGNIPRRNVPTTKTSGRPFSKRCNQAPKNKRAIIALVERGGEVRSFHVQAAYLESVRPSSEITSPARRASIPTKAISTRKSVKSLRRMKPSSTAIKNMRAAT